MHMMLPLTKGHLSNNTELFRRTVSLLERDYTYLYSGKKYHTCPSCRKSNISHAARLASLYMGDIELVARTQIMSNMVTK